MQPKHSKNRLAGYITIALVCAMLGSGITLAATGKLNLHLGNVAMAEETPPAESPFIQVIDKVSESVVGVVNRQRVLGFRGIAQNEIEVGGGSGVVISDNGHILTNYHVIEGASSVQVTAAGRTYNAQVIAYDQTLDLAILRVENLRVKQAVLADSDKVRVGEWAIAIGNPGATDALAGTVTVGIISGLNRQMETYEQNRYGENVIKTNYNLLQTDAPINSGNSGGGLFNIYGQLIGIPTLKYTGNIFSGNVVEGIGLAIPINTAKPLITQYVIEGAPPMAVVPPTDIPAPRPRMGVTIFDLTAQDEVVRAGKFPEGVCIDQVERNSPAARAGLQPSDVITEVDGQRVTSTSQLHNLIGQKNAGDTVVLRIYRVPNIDIVRTIEDIQEGSYSDITVTLEMLD